MTSIRQTASSRSKAILLSTLLSLVSMQLAPVWAQQPQTAPDMDDAGDSGTKRVVKIVPGAGSATNARDGYRQEDYAIPANRTASREPSSAAPRTVSSPAHLPIASAPTDSPADTSKTANTQTSASSSPKVLKGSIECVVPQGTTIKLQMASVPTTGLHLLDRDLDGNLYPAKLGQEVTAKTTEDMYVDDNKVIPEGTVFHGSVSKIQAPRRLHRDGSLSIAFDSFTTPDGRRFEFKAEANNFVASTNKSKLREAGRVLYHAGGGAIVGALIAYQVFGTKGTLACHGYNIAGGAAGGALVATGFALMDKGKKAVLEPGDNLNMEINTDLLIPAAVEPTAKARSPYLEGLTIEVEKSKVIKDGLDGHMVRLDVVVNNDSDKELKAIDLYMEDGNGNRNPLCNGTELDLESTEYLFTLKPHTRRKMRMNFQSEFPKLQRQLVWLDHKSRQICFKQKLPIN
jgi:hypothetical protein